MHRNPGLSTNLFRGFRTHPRSYGASRGRPVDHTDGNTQCFVQLHPEVVRHARALRLALLVERFPRPDASSCACRAIWKRDNDAHALSPPLGGRRGIRDARPARFRRGACPCQRGAVQGDAPHPDGGFRYVAGEGGRQTTWSRPDRSLPVPARPASALFASPKRRILPSFFNTDMIASLHIHSSSIINTRILSFILRFWQTPFPFSLNYMMKLPFPHEYLYIHTVVKYTQSAYTGIFKVTLHPASGAASICKRPFTSWALT